MTKLISMALSCVPHACVVEAFYLSLFLFSIRDVKRMRTGYPKDVFPIFSIVAAKTILFTVLLSKRLFPGGKCYSLVQSLAPQLFYEFVPNVRSLSYRRLSCVLILVPVQFTLVDAMFSNLKSKISVVIMFVCRRWYTSFPIFYSSSSILNCISPLQTTLSDRISTHYFCLWLRYS